MKKLVSFILGVLFVITAISITGCGCKHVFGEWVETTPATTTADGVKERICTSCGTKEQAVSNKKYVLSLSVNNTEYGSVSQTPSEISWGESVTVTAEASDVAVFDAWYKGEDKVCELTSYTFTMPQENLSLTAKFIYTAWLGDTASSFAGGTGTTTDPYLISNGAELSYLSSVLSDSTTASNYKDKNFALTANINLGGKEWKPIGYYQTSANAGNENFVFDGNFYGQGYTVSNYKITQTQRSSDAFFGLFGRVEGNIYNLHVEKGVINLNFSPVTTVRAGLIVGQIRNGEMVGCSAKGSADVKLKNDHSAFVGGMVGATHQSNLYKCFFEGKVSGVSGVNDVTSYSNAGVGGLLGYGGASDGHPSPAYEIKDCYAVTQSLHGNSVNGDTYVGGIMGYGYEYTTNVINCYHLGNSSGSARRYLYVGGIAGQAYLTKNCYQKGNVNVSSGSSSYDYELGVGSIRGSYTEKIYVQGSKYYGGMAKSGINEPYEIATSLNETNFNDFFITTMALDSNVWDLTKLDYENKVYPTLKPIAPLSFS